MTLKKLKFFFCMSAFVATSLSWPTFVLGQQASGPDFAVTKNDVPNKNKNYSPFVNTELPNRVFWGDSLSEVSTYRTDLGV